MTYKENLVFWGLLASFARAFGAFLLSEKIFCIAYCVNEKGGISLWHCLTKNARDEKDSFCNLPHNRIGSRLCG